MKNFFRQNDLCNAVHNGENIWFCKIEFLNQDLEKIKKINKDITLIIGNSDFTFSRNELEQIPDNVKTIYASNSSCTDNIRVFTLPLGVESTTICKREFHGTPFSFASEKEKNIRQQIEKKDHVYKNLIYCNFSISTNFSVRNELMAKALNIKHITTSNNILKYDQYYNEICNHKANLCPIGNGFDTVRTYETLYCNRIPIIYGSDIIYKNLLNDMPCIYIKNLEELENLENMQYAINEKLNNFVNIEKAYLEYWIQKIIKT